MVAHTARVAPEKRPHRPPAAVLMCGGLGEDMARKALSKKTRFEVFKRDGFKCVYCGANPSGALLQVDHVVAVANGGSNDITNLVTSCQPCNLGKSATPLEDVPQPMADLAAAAKEREEQIKGYGQVMASRRERLEDESWEVADIYMQHFNDETFGKADRLSIKQFLEKLPVDECMQAMEIAVSKRPSSRHGSWKYFCGICWNKIKNGAASPVMA